MEPHVVEVSKEAVVDQTVVNRENADVAAEGKSCEFFLNGAV